MTLTETRPEAAPEEPQAAQATPARESIFATADHKRVGRVQLVAALLFLAVGAVCLAVSRAGPGDLGVSASVSGRATSAETTFLYVLGLPLAWLGLAAVVVPLQIGAWRVALPRLHAAAIWSALLGAVVIAVGYLSGSASDFDLNSFHGPVAPESGAKDATEMVIGGLVLVAVAITLQAASLVTTILTQRAEGMTIGRIPLFSVSILVTSSVLLIAVPVFIAGLVLLWLDQHFGGQLFAETSLATDRLWQHFLFLPGWPLLLLMAVPALGALTDAVAGNARRQLLGHPIAGGLLTAFALLTVLTWAAGRNRLYAITHPISTVPLALMLAPIGLLLLLWLGTLRFGKAKFHASLLGAALSLVLVGAGIAGVVAAALIDVEADDAAAFARGTITLLALGVPAVALVAAIAYWAPKITGRAPSTGAAGIAALLVFAGVLVSALPGWIVGFDASDDTWGIAVAGGALLALGFLATAGALKAGPAATDDPYGAATLEWATTSPPPAHNFDRLPEVRSSAPLADVRDGGDA